MELDVSRIFKASAIWTKTQLRLKDLNFICTYSVLNEYPIVFHHIFEPIKINILSF
jgi:hypothetical protein